MGKVLGAFIVRTLKRFRLTLSPKLAFGFVILLCVPAAVHGVTLQSVYDSAPRQFGYDKYLELSSAVTYTGGITILGGDSVCIKGHEAIIDLQGSTIEINGGTGLLDIDHCIILNGGNPDYGASYAALNFLGAGGNVVNNTIYGSTVGIRIYVTAPDAVRIKNNIVVKSTHAGILWQIGSDPVITYNDCWANGGYGDYALDCG